MYFFGDLLRFVYDGLEKDIFSADARNDALNPSSREGSSDNDDDDDEEEIDLENQKEFFRWELRVSSRFSGTHDFTTGDPAVSAIGQKKVQAELQHFERQVCAMRPSSPASQIDN